MTDLPGTWRLTTLDDLLEPGSLTYGIVQPGAHDDDGVPIVRVKNLEGGRVASDSPLRVSPAVERSYGRSRIRPGDVLLSLVGSVGTCAIAGPEHDAWNLARAVALVRPRKDIGPMWIAYCLRGPDAQTFIREVVNTTVQTTLNLRDLKKVPIPLPPSRERRAIAEVLGPLDDKIDSNQRLSAICRELIRLELDTRESDSWPAVPVSSLASFVNGGAYTKGASGTGRMVIRIAELRKGPGPSTVYNDIDVPDERTARAGDLLMAWSGSLGVHIWLGPEAIVNQHIFKVLPGEVPAWLLFDRLERVMPEFRRIAADKATTMGHIKRHHLDDARVRVPRGVELAELDALVDAYWSRALAADLESRTLAELRDALLPELLSGRLRVPVAEDLVEEAT